ncbi:hypothetical protein [Bartonella sp. DGB2]|uniref:hypothetical protein n=1 Tax=Bartonella sp. DGB2 TaxID=3388426 RepID=UPI00398F98EC
MTTEQVELKPEKAPTGSDKSKDTQPKVKVSLGEVKAKDAPNREGIWRDDGHKDGLAVITRIG